MKKLKKHLKAFTLVELIIVITILAILATIAFISFQNYTKDARDGNRISTLTSIEKGLELYMIKVGKYPQPDGDVLTGALLLSGSELVYSSMGIIDETLSTMIKMNKTPLDPVSNSKYVYAVNNKQDKYQIATILENLEANSKLPLIEQTYANENYKAKVVGNHEVNVKIPKDDKIWFITVPSMIFAGTGNILNSSGTYHIINGGQNIPYKTNDKIITTKETGDKIIQHIRKSQNAKIVTVDITDIVNEKNETTRKTKIEEKFGTGGTNEVLPGITSKEALASIGAITGTNEIPNTTLLTQTVESIITGGSSSSASSYTAPKTPKTCPHLGEEIQDTGTMIVYSENSINKFANYTCEDRKGLVTCNDGVLSGDTEFAYKSGECVKGEINNCSASGSYLHNGHTYSISPLNHGSGATNIVSTGFSENNGTFQYTLTNIECNDGVLVSASESATPVLQSCDPGFGQNGTICSPSQNGSCNNTQAFSCIIGDPIEDNGQTTCGQTRTWKCSGVYGGNESAQCSFTNPSCQANPTNLTLNHTTRSKTFTFSWTAGVGNGGSCKLQYNKNGTWTNINETIHNCDTTILNTTVTLPGDSWYSGNWNGVQVRIIRTSDSTVLGTLGSLLCSTTSGSSSSTPTIDEDCNGSWDNFSVGSKSCPSGMSPYQGGTFNGGVCASMIGNPTYVPFCAGVSGTANTSVICGSSVSDANNYCNCTRTGMSPGGDINSAANAITNYIYY